MSSNFVKVFSVVLSICSLGCEKPTERIDTKVESERIFASFNDELQSIGKEQESVVKDIRDYSKMEIDSMRLIESEQIEGKQKEELLDLISKCREKIAKKQERFHELNGRFSEITKSITAQIKSLNERAEAEANAVK